MPLLKIDNVTVSPSPSAITYEVFDIQDADRNARGDLVMQIINRKRKVSCTWTNVTGVQIKNILSQIQSDVISYKTFFNVTYEDMDTTLRTINCYKGDRSATMYMYKPNGLSIYSTFTVNFIQR